MFFYNKLVVKPKGTKVKKSYLRNLTSVVLVSKQINTLGFSVCWVLKLVCIPLTIQILLKSLHSITTSKPKRMVTRLDCPVCNNKQSFVGLFPPSAVNI